MSDDVWSGMYVGCSFQLITLTDPESHLFDFFKEFIDRSLHRIQTTFLCLSDANF